MENSESETDALERLLEKISLTSSTHTPSMEDMDISHLSSTPEAQQVTARRRLPFSEVSFENEPDLVSGAINPSSIGDILHLDDHTYHEGHSSFRVTSQDIKTNKKKQSFTEYSFENQPDLLSASTNPMSLGDILPLDDHTHHAGHSSTRELTTDPLSKKRKLSHTIVSSENQPQVALASTNPMSLGDILPLDDNTHHGSHSSRTELTTDPLSKKRKLSHTIVSSENQPQVALDLEESPGNIYSNETLGATCATISSESDRLSPMLETASTNPMSLGDILPLDDNTHHGSHSSRTELTTDPLSKKRKLSHTIVSSENQPQVALVKVDTIRCVANPNRVDMQHLKTTLLNIILHDLDGDNENQNPSEGNVAGRRFVWFKDVMYKLFNTDVLHYRTRRDICVAMVYNELLTLASENEFMLENRDGDVMISHYQSGQVQCNPET